MLNRHYFQHSEQHFYSIKRISFNLLTNNKKMLKIASLLCLLSLQFVACGSANIENQSKILENQPTHMEHITEKKMDTATFGAGCFWCTEAQFQQLEGVLKVESGYSGGTVASPTYKQVCTGTTGHAEVTRIFFDPNIITYEELLAAFWLSHDPTQLNRQGNDVGTQYRSVIFYHDETQKQKAETYKNNLNKEGAYNNPIVTEISPATTFYKAEDYHQNYYNENGNQPYCLFVIKPKLDKFEKAFKNKLKKVTK